METAPGNPCTTVGRGAKPVDNPVDVETRLLPGNPLCRKGLLGYPLPVEIAPTVTGGVGVPCHTRIALRRSAGLLGGNAVSSDKCHALRLGLGGRCDNGHTV